MFGLGSTEVGLVFLILLLVFGPSQIPKIARGLGRAMHEFRNARREIQNGLQTTDTPAPPPPPESKPVQ